jgi:hypothetical protein
MGKNDSQRLMALGTALVRVDPAQLEGLGDQI